jgi:predicted N-acetyltransferase YhbS
MQIRLATVDDARAIAEVHVRAWQVAYRSFLPAEVMDALDAGEREQTWRAFLSDPSNEIQTMVAEDETGRVVGFVSVTGASRDPGAPAGVAEIAALYVEPAYWRRGIGRGLVMAGLAALRAAGGAEVTLWVFEPNTGGIGFYRAAGFKPDGGRKVGRTGVPEIRLRRLLGSHES